MEKRRNYVVIPLALLFFAILGLNIWVFKSIGRTNTVIDKTVIEHTQLEFFVPGKRILIQASILDPAGVAEARLYFSASKDIKNLAFSKMKPQGDSYAGVIPTPSSETEKIFYSILAVNHNGDVVKTGLFELQANKNIGFVPTWQGDFNEYGKTLILGKEDTSGTLSTVIDEPSSPVIAEPSSPVIASEAKQSHGLEGFADSIIVNIVKPEERYFAAKKVQRVAGLSTIDGGEAEPAPGEPKEGLSKNEKIAIGAGIGAAAVGGIIAAASGGGGGGGGGGGTTTTVTETTTTTEGPTTTETTTTTSSTTTTTLPPVINIPPKVGVPPAEITFNPTVGQVGDPISVAICFDPEAPGGTVGLGSGWQIRVKVDGEKKEYNVCNTFGPCGINCDLGQIFKLSSTDHEIVFKVNLEDPPGVTLLFNGSLPLEFNAD